MKAMSKILLVFSLLSCALASQAVNITYNLTTHTDGRTITGTANLSSGAELLGNMPQALWRAYCTYTFYKDEALTEPIDEVDASVTTVWVDYVFDPPFHLSEEGSDPIWHYLRSYNSGGTNNYIVYYDQGAEDEWGSPKRTIKGYKSTSAIPTPKYGSNQPMTKETHCQWAFYGDAYDFHIKLNDPTISNPWLIWNSTSATEYAMGLGAKKPIGWQLYVNTATNSKLSGGTMAMGPYGATNYLASLENVSSSLETDRLDTSRQFFDSHNQLVHKTGTSSSTSYKNNLWWYAFFATPITQSPTSTDVWHVTYKLMNEEGVQIADDIVKQTTPNTVPVYPGEMNIVLYDYSYYSDAELQNEWVGYLPTDRNSIVYVKQTPANQQEYITDHWITIVLPYEVSDLAATFGTTSDGETPAVRVLEYKSVSVTKSAEKSYSFKLNFTQVNGMEANKPYLFKADEVLEGKMMSMGNGDEDELISVVQNDASFPEVPVTMNGTYEGVTLSAGDENKVYFYFGYKAGADSPYNFYIVKKDTPVGKNRAYFLIEDTSDAESVAISFDLDVDGISETLMEPVALRGVPGGEVYNLNGQLVAKDAGVNALPRGIYVVNGRKYVVK